MCARREMRALSLVALGLLLMGTLGRCAGESEIYVCFWICLRAASRHCLPIELLGDGSSSRCSSATAQHKGTAKVWDSRCISRRGVYP